jgi:hypothetical protein
MLSCAVLRHSAGHVITNYHVITDASEIQVTFQGGTEYSAKVVGFDTDKDIAVLKVCCRLLWICVLWPCVPAAPTSSWQLLIAFLKRCLVHQQDGNNYSPTFPPTCTSFSLALMLQLIETAIKVSSTPPPPAQQNAYVTTHNLLACLSHCPCCS